MDGPGFLATNLTLALHEFIPQDSGMTLPSALPEDRPARAQCGTAPDSQIDYLAQRDQDAGYPVLQAGYAYLLALKQEGNASGPAIERTRAAVAAEIRHLMEVIPPDQDIDQLVDGTMFRYVAPIAPLEFEGEISSVEALGLLMGI